MREEGIGGRFKRLPRHGWPATYPVVQFPNVPLGAAIVAGVAERLTEGREHDVAAALAALGLGVWAYLELAEGDNAFRRVLGAAGLVIVVLRLADAG